MRRLYVDNIRWMTVCVIVVFHVVYIFNAIVREGTAPCFRPVQYQDAYMYLVYPWMLIILFIISGMCARWYLEKHGLKEFFISRTDKLLIPSTLGMLVFHWIHGYINIKAAGGYSVLGLPKYLEYPVMVIEGLGALWFIQALWVFSMLLIAVRLLENRSGGKLFALSDRYNAPLAAALVLPVWGASFILNLSFYKGYKMGIYGLCFFIGYFVFANERVI
ncbi:MAG: acyltransferase family protein, partial [Eubacterium sp.]|nr:acyltransferase family protein [Eubacterium sp.]